MRVRLKGLMDVSYQDYRKPSMVLTMAFCDFKCWKGELKNPCQNSALAHSPIILVNTETILERYMKNPLSKALVFSGLEPLLQKYEMFGIVDEFRKQTMDDIVIFTGYDMDEIDEKFLDSLRPYENIYLKLGRYVPNSQSKYDPVLGITLASDNQYGIKIN